MVFLFYYNEHRFINYFSFGYDMPARITGYDNAFHPAPQSPDRYCDLILRQKWKQKGFVIFNLTNKPVLFLLHKNGNIFE